MSLWGQEFGEIGATLKVLDKHGLTAEDFSLIRQDPDGFGKIITESIRNRAAIHPIVRTEIIKVAPFSMYDMTEGFKLEFGEGSRHEDWAASEIGVSPKEKVEQGFCEFAVFKFGLVDLISGIEPKQRMAGVKNRIERAGYKPATFWHFMGYILHLRNKTESPLVCPCDLCGNILGYPCLYNHGPSVVIGSVSIDREMSDPYAYFYLGYKPRNEEV